MTPRRAPDFVDVLLYLALVCLLAGAGLHLVKDHRAQRAATEALAACEAAAEVRATDEKCGCWFMGRRCTCQRGAKP